ncbi:twin-arginine translocation signal domain-containing protein [Halopelagius longus]|uniref:Tat (Twin-arginine translocation) pathway signal sequence n=1 Tax=Halopelagius longus TaxID=1236180 RepID=A0A1H0XU26_9EURY|nr:twin-arginine translocation signal domain-containing protein [Halopelagius longus]RDI73095.1 hypothetical protein DWB78_10410 [Halopelagius longus]SDQ06418.1 Tat (twin-arginine translocation) pathway signal sequence [Halopelagius longus]
MTDDYQPNDQSRRSFMKTGAAASGAVALGLVSSGSAAAQQGTETPQGGTSTQDDDGITDEGYKALIFEDDFQPAARFTFVSGVIEWTPNWADVRDSAWSEYNTYQIRWLHNGQVDTLFVTQDASEQLTEFDQNLGFIPDEDDVNQPAVWEMSREWAPFGDNERLQVVNFSEVNEEEEDQILQDDDWWDDQNQTQTETQTQTQTQTQTETQTPTQTQS